MSRRLVFALGVSATGLIAAIALELNNPEAGVEVPVPASRPVVAGQSAPPVDIASHIPEWADRILERPLFSRDRRPAARSTPTASSGTGPVPLPRLSGVIVSGSGRSAIFAGAAGGHVTVIGEGAKIGRYTVDRIEAGRVTVAGPEGKQVLRLHAPKGAPAKAIAVKSGSGRPGSVGAGSAQGGPAQGDPTTRTDGADVESEPVLTHQDRRSPGP